MCQVPAPKLMMLVAAKWREFTAHRDGGGGEDGEEQQAEEEGGREERHDEEEEEEESVEVQAPVSCLCVDCCAGRCWILRLKLECTQGPRH